MERKVTITVRGDDSAYTVPGVMERGVGKLLLRYAESAATGMGRVETVLTLSEGLAVLRRTGAVHSEFRFAEGVPHRSVYATPHGSFPAEVEARSLRVRAGEHSVLADLRYRLTIGGAESERRLKILVRTEDGG